MKLKFIIYNHMNTVQTAKLYGVNENFMKVNYGSDYGVRIRCYKDGKLISYNEILEQARNTKDFKLEVVSISQRNKETIKDSIHLEQINNYAEANINTVFVLPNGYKTNTSTGSFIIEVKDCVHFQLSLPKRSLTVIKFETKK